MIRLVLLGLVLMGLTACAPPYRSAVDMVPFETRPASPPIAEGRYCGGEYDTGRSLINSTENCATLVWDRATRTYSVSRPADEDGDQPPEIVVLAEIARGLFVRQFDTEEGPARYVLSVCLIHGNALSPAMPPMGEAWTPEMIARHPKVAFAYEEEHPYIAAGERSDIVAFLKDVTIENFRQNIAGSEKIYFLVRDDAGSSEHEPDAAQWGDIDAIRTQTKALLQHAPATE